MRESMIEKLSDVEHVCEENSARQAIKLIPKVNPDVVIIDVVMTAPNSFETTRCIVSKVSLSKFWLLSGPDVETNGWPGIEKNSAETLETTAIRLHSIHYG
jgi:DNA-binding NarL/FixJ family response regulator